MNQGEGVSTVGERVKGVTGFGIENRESFLKLPQLETTTTTLTRPIFCEAAGT